MPSRLNGRLARLSADCGAKPRPASAPASWSAVSWPRLGAVGTLVWLSITLFIWLAERFDDPTLAGLVLSGVYLRDHR